MPKITSADCVAAIVAEFNKVPLSNDVMVSLDAYMWDEVAGPTQQTNPTVEYARNPKHWKRHSKKSFPPNAIPVLDKTFLDFEYPPLSEVTPENFGEMVQRHQRNYNPDSGKITKRWFTCYDDDPDDPTDAHWHAQVYEQDGKIIQVSIYGEG